MTTTTANTAITGQLFNYTTQAWEEINTDTDECTGNRRYRTPTGLTYETRGEQYRGF